MDRLTKTVFILLLLLISFSASGFMILESGSFFQRLYSTTGSISFMGYWAAFLNEVFMGIMAAVWLPAIKNGNGEKIHPLNFAFKTLLVFLFISTVCGASLNTVHPLIEAIQTKHNEGRIIKILESQVQDNNQSLSAFVQQNQRVNAAISVRNQVKTKEELKEMVQLQTSAFGLWIEITIITLIRFGVQLANLSCIWLAGWVYRHPNREAIQPAPKPQPTAETTKCPACNPEEDLHLPLHHPKQSDTACLKKTTATDSTQARSPHAIRKKRPAPEYAFGARASSPPQNKETIVPHRLNEPVYAVQKRIAQLLKSRNEGISLSQIGEAIGETEAHLKTIVEPNVRLDPSSMPELQAILTKIETLYHDEQTRSA